MVSGGRGLHRNVWYVAIGCLLIACACTQAADFNGDGKQDILWRTPDGNPLIWQMNGLSIGSQYTLSIAPDAGSAIASSGKFFAAGTGGILWVDSTDHISLWQVNNGNITQACYAASGLDPSWSFLGIGDINADGIVDVLWRLPNGSIEVLLINGCNAPQTVALVATADPSWSLAGIGDFDGDGHSDLLWRNSNGDVVVWQVGNNATVTQTTLAAGTYAGWSVSAVADFDGDGKSDILWRDAGGNNTALWLMDGVQHTVASVAPVSPTVFAAADAIFTSGFEYGAQSAPALSSAWTILGAADFNGDGRADVLLADIQGDTAIWQMQGALIEATALFRPSGDMPYVGLTGWKLPLDRPTVTKANDQVTVAWAPIPGSPSYSAYASATNEPASTGTAIPVSGTTLSFARSATGYADKRYFAIGAQFHGIRLPPSPEAYIVEFTQINLPYWGAMAIADIDGDGCMDILGALGDCHGNFQLLSEANMGLTALRASGRVYRDLRFADLDGDGIDDLIANTYSSIDDTNSQVLFFRGIGNKQFVEDTAFSNLNIRGYGETIVIADFNNDGHLDVFLPHYSFNSPDEHSWLLINDGSGHFTDVSDAAGVAMRNVPACARTEGAQALDINSDGWIDLYAGSHLFLNNGSNQYGIPTFQDLGAVIDTNCNIITPSPAGLPVYFDEGAKFIDLDNSGQLTLVLNTVYTYYPPPGIHTLKFDGVGHFSEINAIPEIYMNQSLGLTATDVDGDGLTDIVVAGGCDPVFYQYPSQFPDPYCPDYGNPHDLPQLLVNRGGQFVSHDFYSDGLTLTQRDWNDLQSFADFDYSGTMDFVSRFSGADADGTNIPSGYVSVLMNRAVSFDTITVSIVGNNGKHNQAGRVVHVTPNVRPSVTMTQVVDGGSGYMANGPYDLSFATPYPGSYTISVRFAGAAYTTTARAGDHVTLYANGTVTTQ